MKRAFAGFVVALFALMSSAAVWAQTISITAPVEGARWARGATQSIQWESNAGGNVKIETIYNAVATTLVESTANIGSYNWIVSASQATGDYQVRLTSLEYPELTALSGTFSIVAAAVEVTSPAGGEVWARATAHNIRWASDAGGQVRLDLYDAGEWVAQICAATENNGAYKWIINDTISVGTNYRVRVTSLNDGSVYGESPATFEIAKTGTIVVSAPAGDEHWARGTRHLIEWTSNIDGVVKLELYSNGASYSVIVEETSNANTSVANTYAWTIPSDVVPGSAYTIKITSEQYDISAYSNAFTIDPVPYITLNRPNGGEKWATQTRYPIEWVTNAGGEVKLECSLTGANGPWETIVDSAPNNGVYQWKTPNDVSNEVQVRLTGVSDPDLTDISDTVFSLAAPYVTVTYPAGGENLYAERQYNITWVSNLIGSTDSLAKIELSADGGATWSDIAAAVENTGVYLWTVPKNTMIGDQYAVRVTVGATAAVSAAPFTISGIPYVKVTSPNGGEDWARGTVRNIEWETNTPGYVKILLLKEGTVVNVVTSSTINNGRYDNWTIPATLDAGDTYKIKIENVSDATISDISDRNFSIDATPTIALLSPNGGESWGKGSVRTITWTSNVGGTVTVALLKGGAQVLNISAGAENSGSLSWAVPVDVEAGGDYRVRITSDVDADWTGQSAADFAIVNGALTVTSPAAGVYWGRGAGAAASSHEIRWTSDMASSLNVTLSYSSDGGTTWTTIVAATPNDGAYSWDLPATLPLTATYLVRVQALGASILDDGGPFTVIEPEIDIQLTGGSPNGGETWQSGKVYTINWFSNIGGDAKIDLYKDGTLFQTISPSTDNSKETTLSGHLYAQSYAWTIPKNTPSSTGYKVVITSLPLEGEAAGSTISLENFTIVSVPFIEIVSPLAGDSWIRGADHEIVWNTNMGGTVTVSAFFQGLWEPLATGVANAGSYTWNISTTQETGDYKIRVTSEQDGLVTSTSGEFQITAPYIRSVDPAGGENVALGATLPITWESNIGGKVRISLLKSGNVERTVTSETDNDGAYIWTVPTDLTIGNDYRIYVQSVSFSGIDAQSAATFTIDTAHIEIATPNGGEIIEYAGGSAYTIKWSSNIGGAARIDLYKGGQWDSAIATSVATVFGENTYEWTLAQTLRSGDDYRIKITSAKNAEEFDFSDNDFTIIGFALELISPNGGEKYVIGNTYSITWYSNAVTDTVRLDLYKNGDFVMNIATGLSPQNGVTPEHTVPNYSWTVPTTLVTGTDYKVRIATTDAAIESYSAADFSVIAPNITVLSPKGGETWTAGATYTIEWSANITGTARFDLYKGGVFAQTIQSGWPVNTIYEWTLPANLTPGTDYRVRIVSEKTPSIYGESAADFTIVAPVITVLSPNGGEEWYRSLAYPIVWSSNLRGNVVIDLYKSGVKQFNIAETENNGSYTWNIPADLQIGGDFRVLIRSSSYEAVYDESGADFSVIDEPSYIRIIRPDGSRKLTIDKAVAGVNGSFYVDGDLTREFPPGSALKVAGSTGNNGTYTSKNVLFSDGKTQIIVTGSIKNSSSVADGYIDFTEIWAIGSPQTIKWASNLSGYAKIELMGTYLILAVSQADKRFTIAGDLVDQFMVGAKFMVGGSSANDGTYTVAGVTLSGGQTEILVDADIPSDIVDGYIGTPRRQYFNLQIAEADPDSQRFTVCGDQRALLAAENGVFVTGSALNNGQYTLAETPEKTTRTFAIVEVDQASLTFSVADNCAALFPVGSAFTISGSTGNNGTYTVASAVFNVDVTEITVTQNVPSFKVDGQIDWTGTILTVRQEIPSPTPGGLVGWNGVIAAAAENNGEFDWAVPAILEGTNYRVRVSGENNANVSDISENNFQIKEVAAYLLLISPNGGETWGRGSTREIAWDSNAGGTVKIDLYKNGFWNSTIAYAAPNNGAYNWPIPAGLPPGLDYQVVLTVNENTLLNAKSAENFAISETFISVLSPNGGEHWALGQANEILWESNAPGNVKIELLRYNTVSEAYEVSLVLSYSTPNDGAFSWVVPTTQIPGNGYKVRITSVVDVSIVGSSYENFSIQSPYLSVRAPNGGERWARGATRDIAWLSNIADALNIWLLKGQYGIIGAQAGAGGFFTVAGDRTGVFPVGGNFAVTDSTGNNKMYTAATVTYSQSSDATVIVVAAAETIPSAIAAGYLRPSALRIAESIPNTGIYKWTISNTLVAGSDYRVRVASAGDDTIWDMGDADFSIVPQLRVTSPNGGEVWYRDAAQNITWTSDAGGSVRIELYQGGLPISPDPVIIADSTPNDGTFEWVIPSDFPLAVNYTIFISSVEDPLVNDQSNQPFAIAQAGIALISPNGGEDWGINTRQTITWLSSTGSDNVKLELLKTGVVVLTIADTTANDGAFDWVIPAETAADTDYRVRATALAQSGVPETTDQSAADFTISEQDYIRVDTPSGQGVEWIASRSYTIAWASNLTGNVKIDLYKGGTLLQTIVNSTPNNKGGTYLWTVPNSTAVSDNYRVRVTSLEIPAVTDQNDYDFTITRGTITVVNPASGAVWGTGKLYATTWTSENVTGNVKIELLKAGVSVLTLADSVAVDSGSYSWRVPQTQAAGVDYQIQITSLENSVVIGFSAAFTIEEADYVIITAPNGGETYPRGTMMPIAWQTNLAASQKVNLTLLKGGELAATIATDIGAQTLAYNWTIPASVAVGDDYRVYIEAAADPTQVYDQSDADFSITAPTIAVAPTSLAQQVEWRTDAESQTFVLTMTGSGVANYAITDNADWLSVTPESGTLTVDSPNVTLTVAYSTRTLASGTYTAAITVTAPEAGNSPIPLPVTMTVLNPVPTESLIFWYRGDKVTPQGNAVLVWPDQSGNGNNASQKSLNRAPWLVPAGINDCPDIGFGGKESLVLPSCFGVNEGGPFYGKTLCLVFETRLDTATRQVIYKQGGKETGLVVYLDGRRLYFNSWNAASWGQRFISTPILPETPYCVTFTFDAANSAVKGHMAYLENAAFVETEFASAGGNGPLGSDKGAGMIADTSGGVRFHDSGGAKRFAGEIAEMVYYNQALSDTDRVSMETRMAYRYYIQAPALPEGMDYWFRPDVGVTLYNGGVSSWTDRSGSASVIKQNTPTARPALGDDTIIFNGAGSYLYGGKLKTDGAKSALTLYAVFKTGADVNTRQTIWAQGQGGTASGLNVYIESGALFAGIWGKKSAGVAFIQADGLATDTLYVLEVVFNGTSLSGLLNGAAIDPVATAAALELKSLTAGAVKNSALIVGGQTVKKGAYFAGETLDAFAYPRVLTTEETAAVQNYLDTRYPRD